MNQEQNQFTIEDQLINQYSFLQDAAFIELNNAIGVSEDQNKYLKSGNSFLKRVTNIVFGTRDAKQIQINEEHNVAIKKFVQLDKRRASQLLKTKQGLKKTLIALVALKKEHIEFKLDVDQSIQNIESDIQYLNKGISTRDRVKTTLNYWEINDISMSPYSQLILLLAQLKWTEFEELAKTDEDFKNWMKSELIKACCNKFGCKAQQLVPLNSVINDLKLEEKIIQDALKLALPSFNHIILNQTQSVLMGEINQANMQPILSLQRLSDQLLEGVIQ
nr:hypothetical protein [Moritella viscosa]SHO18075.1 Putative uncharacterized protein [Moritella viscosa]